MEAIYLASITAALFFYTHIALTYAFSVKYLSLLDRSENYHLTPLASSFALVCLMSYLYYFTPVSSAFFPYAFNLVMLSVMVAKCFYFYSLRKLLKAKFPVDKVYVRLAIGYALLSVYFMVDASFNGMETYFDLEKPETSGLILREKLLPFEINSLVKLLFLPNYLLGFAFYVYLAVVALRRGEKLIAFGVCFTIGSILFTNSYHLFKVQYWLPLNIVADLFEMLRLHWAQRENLALKVDAYNKEMSDVNQRLAGLSQQNGEFQVFKHDLNNSLQIASFNLYKAKLLLRKAGVSGCEKALECIDRSLSAQQTAGEFGKNQDAQTEASLKDLLEKVCRLSAVELRCENLDGALVRAAKVKLENALINIVKNAKEANEGQDGFHLRARLKEEEEFVSLMLRDTGAFERIKEPDSLFERGVSTKGSHGRGLGLYSVREFMREIGGDARLLNDKGNVCFSLRFPKQVLKKG